MIEFRTARKKTHRFFAANKTAMRTILSAVFSLLTILSAAQTGKGKITVTINDEQNNGVEGATVELLRSRDSALVKTTLSDKNGLAEWDAVTPATYLIRASGVGLAVTYSPVFEVKPAEVINAPVIRMATSNASQLQGVTVAAKKPFIQRLNDRLIVNVESSLVNVGSSAFEVLERSPGVTIDQNDAISLRGKAGVIIMIDGKPSPMSGADLANYLRGLPVNAIERIELITNPSSKYDAAGNSGIIDIRMKKDQRLGYNGTFTAGYGQGVYPKWNAGSTFNYRNKGVNIFGNYNYGYRENLNHLLINRNFYEAGILKGSDDKDNYAWMPFKGHTVRAGADFFPSKNTIIGVVVNGSFNRFKRQANITTMVNDEAFRPDFRFNSIGTNNDRFGNTVANINLKQKLDSNGRELTADVDYGVFNNHSLTRTASYFFNLNGSKRKEDDILDGDQQGKVILKTAKADYVHPLKGGAKLEAGAKTSYVSSDKDAKFYNVFPSQTLVDGAKTNHFLYEEYNNAAYLNFSKEANKFNYQLGLRGELTNLKTFQAKGSRKFSNDYFQLFPSAFINYKLAPEKTIGLSVSRRIDRPGYSSLDPFLFQVDATIYSTGDPLLKPQFTWSYEVNYTVKNLNFSLGCSRTTQPQNVVLSKILDVIPTFEIKPGEDSNITVQIPVNLISSDYLGLTATLPVRLTAWWNMMNNVNVFYNKFNGALSGAQLNDGTTAANFRTVNNFTFKRGWSAELNASLNTGGRNGYMVFKTQWGLGLGAQKTIMQGKGTLRLNVTDIFWTNLPNARVEYRGSYVENWHAYRESRVANISFTYRFGNNNVQAARRRTTASEEERQRAGGN